MTCRVLYIDDERHPEKDQHRYRYPEDARFDVVRTLRELIQWLDANPLPDVVSFDFHLHVTDPLRNGADLACMMAFHCDLDKESMPYVMVHSADADAPKKIGEALSSVFDFNWEDNEKKEPF